MQESEKTADAIRAFNKQCAGVDYGADGKRENECRDKREALVGALAKFVILANTELDYLPEDPAKYRAEQQARHPELQFETSPEGDRQTIARRTDTQLQIKWAHHYIDCLGRENVPQCEQEKAELDKAEYPFGRIGLASPDKPTHEGDEEAKHWHAYPIKILPSPTPSR